MSAPLERLLFELIFIAVTPPNILFFFLYNFIEKFFLSMQNFLLKPFSARI
ncbi:uncharacterized protein METZ01_LOCUS329547 [marine metagenome]|uniref:Uncharacterized protein n=1 Tax=marine metagenome TaxID=408172 RepID=A0A382PTH6_9ZZZZ